MNSSAKEAQAVKSQIEENREKFRYVASKLELDHHLAVLASNRKILDIWIDKLRRLETPELLYSEGNEECEGVLAIRKIATAAEDVLNDIKKIQQIQRQRQLYRERKASQ